MNTTQLDTVWKNSAQTIFNGYKIYFNKVGTDIQSLLKQLQQIDETMVFSVEFASDYYYDGDDNVTRFFFNSFTSDKPFDNSFESFLESLSYSIKFKFSELSPEAQALLREIHKKASDVADSINAPGHDCKVEIYSDTLNINIFINVNGEKYKF